MQLVFLWCAILELKSIGLRSISSNWYPFHGNTKMENLDAAPETVLAADSTIVDNGLYKLVIIGGGPAGVGVFVRAARSGFLPRLLDPAVHGTVKDLDASQRCGRKQKGVAILHDGDTTTFGSGNLGAYIINSNTFARSLIGSVLDNKPDLDPPESIKNTFLEAVRDSESAKRLEAIGMAPACLVDFGKFLNCVGMGVMKELGNHSDTSKCLLKTRAVTVNMLPAGIWRIEARCLDQTIVMHSEHVAFAMGGKQDIPKLENPAHSSKLFTSDACLREDGFALLKEHLLKAKEHKVCVVGGSHSSFSAAWLLLNKLKRVRAPSIKADCSVTEPAQQPTEVHINPAVEDPAAAELLVKTPPVAESSLSPDLSEQSSVGKPKSSTGAATGFSFLPKDITILHRHPIRCYYASRKDAESDGADGSRVDRSGCVNTFTGLREDSKRLFKDAKSGKESRVRLFQVNPQGCQSLTQKAFDSATAIIWCCGYTTRMLPVLDTQGKPLQFVQEHGVVKLNLRAHLQPVTPQKEDPTAICGGKLFGLGLGFSLRSAVDEMGTETRADGVTVYHRRGATLVLGEMFGSEVYGTGCNTFEEMVENNDSKKKTAASVGKPELQQPSSTSSLLDKVKR